MLADRGLVGAVQALALTGSIPVEVQTNLDGRLPAPVESAAYFAVAEALANAIKHSGATAIDIELTARRRPAAARGRATTATAGPRSSAGTGLRGIERRLGAFDGHLAVDSPAGGPTVVAMELPLPRRDYVSGMPTDERSAATADGHAERTAERRHRADRLLRPLRRHGVVVRQPGAVLRRPASR